MIALGAVSGVIDAGRKGNQRVYGVIVAGQNRRTKVTNKDANKRFCDNAVFTSPFFLTLMILLSIIFWIRFSVEI